MVDLYNAAHGGDAKKVLRLVKGGLFKKPLDVNYQTENRQSALWIAAWFGRTEIISILLDHGATIDLPNRIGATPLMIASELGHREAVKVLLQRKAKIECTMQTGETALYMATWNGKVDVAELLIRHGANVDAVKDGGWTILNAIANTGNITLMKCLLRAKQRDVNKPNTAGPTPLWHAAHQGHTDMVELLLAHDAKLNARHTQNGSTPLYVAADVNQIPVVRLLLQHHADVNIPMTNGSTAVMQAAYKGNMDVVKLLVEAGADLTPTFDGDTARDRALRQGHAAIAAYLLEACRRQGHTALADKRFDDAIAALSQLITDTKSANGQDLLHRSAAYICTRNEVAARGDVKRAMAFGHDDGFAAAGDLLLGLGHTTDAITAFEWGLQDNPTAVACHVGLAKAKDIHDAATRSRALLTRLASNADMREWIMDKRFVAAFLAAQSGPRSGNNDNDPRVQQALAWIQGPIKPPAPATSKPPNHHPSSGPTRSTNHRAIELLAPTTLDPTASLDDLCRYIHSSLTTTTWHIMGHFYLDSSDDGPQLAVFPASHKKQTGKSFVVKLTQCDDELAFADAVDAFQGDKSAFLVDWIDWGPVTLAGVDCFALVMER
ncbi:hypothetical protein As57867_006081, partial [Aphanomyces stellatus]